MRTMTEFKDRTIVYKLHYWLVLLWLMGINQYSFSFHQQELQVSPLKKGGFRAAVVKVDITPDDAQQLLGYHARLSTGIHDRIYHRVMVMDDGNSLFVLVSSDLGLIAPSEYDKVAARIKKELNISEENFWWSVTHTHSAPELGDPGLPEVFLSDRYTHQYDKKYTNTTEAKLVKAVEQAIDNLEPAKLAIGWGHSNANINRRGRDSDGNTYLGLNPDLPVDRRIGMFRIDAADGSPIAIIANYAMHGTVAGGGSTLISGDGPGIVTDYVERKTGATMLFINGAAGNIAPIYSQQPDLSRVKELEPLLGDRILDAFEAMTTFTSEVIFNTGTLTVEVPRLEGLGWPKYMSKYTRKNNAGVDLVKIPVRFFNINKDIAIWATPLELFCEISNEIRNKSPFPYTFYYGFTNGWLGYLMTDEEIPYGGYEVSVTPFRPGAAKELTQAVLGYLEGFENTTHKD